MRLRSLFAFSLILLGVAVVGLVLAYSDHAFGGPGRRPVRREDIAAIAGVAMIVLGVVLGAVGFLRGRDGTASDDEPPAEADGRPTA